jgi:hypothetical protein
MPSNRGAVHSDPPRPRTPSACGKGSAPGQARQENAAGEPAVSIIGEVFTPSLAPHADIVCSRYVLEHLPRPVDLLRTVREA